MKAGFIVGVFLLLITSIIACQSEDELEFKRYYSNGSTVYETKCQNCHGKNGEGLQLLIPALSDSAYIKANKTSLACSLKYGLKGKLTINKKEFDGQMPADDLTEIEIAEVLTYVNNSFGNKLGVVTTEQVGNDLRKCN